MSYEAQAAELARSAVRNHGQLTEVVFISANKDSVLVFADGTVISLANDQSLEREYGSNRGYAEIAQQLGGTHPYSLLAFGYQGTGPQCFAAFLKTAGFDVGVSDIENVAPPLRLRADGSRVRGTMRDGSVEWEDHSQTPDPTLGAPAQKPLGAPAKKPWWRFW
jgi:hypothetical protein